IAIIDVIDPPGELMYMVISRSGSMASRVSSWAMTSFAEASSIWTPRKMIRSSKSLLYGFISLTPYEVRSTKDGSTYLDWGSGLNRVTLGSLFIMADGAALGGLWLLRTRGRPRGPRGRCGSRGPRSRTPWLPPR